MSLEPEPTGSESPSAEPDEPEGWSALIGLENHGLPETLAGLLRVAAIRGVCGGLVFAGVGLLVLSDGPPQSPTRMLSFGLLVAFPLGVWVLAPTALVEGWSRGKAGWKAGLAMYLVILAAWVLGLAQSVYARQLFASESPQQAFLEALRMLGSLPGNLELSVLLLLLPLPFVIVGLFRSGLLRRRPVGWTIWALIALAAASQLSRAEPGTPLRVWTLAPLAILVLSAPLIGLFWVIDLAHHAHWPPEGAEPSKEPKPELRPIDWLLLGGPSYTGSTLVAVAVGAWLFQDPRFSAWSLAWVFACWFLHMVFAANLAPLYLRIGWVRPALEVARYHLRSASIKTRSARLAFRVPMVLAHLRLGEPDAAKERLLEITPELRDTLVDRTRRLQLAAAFVEAGEGATALDLVSEPPEASWGRLSVHRTITETAALWALERFEEGLEKLGGIDREAQPKRIQAYLDANRAAFLLASGGDAQEALALTRGAQHTLPTTRGNLGVAMLLAGESLEEALEHIEAGLAQERISPHGRTWLERHRSIALERLGRS